MLHIYIIREVQIKTTRYPTHLFQWPKSSPLTPPNAGGDGGQQELSHSLGGDAEWCAAVEDMWAVSYETDALLS